MNPTDREILLDAYNLRLRHGSGIKTYGLTLVDALQRLGSSVSLLSDRGAARTRHEPLQEVLFHDVEQAPGRSGRMVQRLRHSADHLRRALTPVRALPVPRHHVIPDGSRQGLAAADQVYAVRDVYDVANTLYRSTGRLTRVLPPGAARVWHATTPLPIRVPGLPMVTTIHDLVPLRVPYATLDHKKTFYKLVSDALRDSALVLTVSDCTRRDLLTWFSVPEEKVVTTWQAVPHMPDLPAGVNADLALEPYGLQPGRYILFVGNIEPKKNLAALAQAVSMLPEDLPLVVVGRKAWLYEEQLEQMQSVLGASARRRSSSAKERLLLLDWVPTPMLRVLYTHAACLAFPSLYEGFGLPPLEAMRHGCPVVVSDNSSLPEVCGDAALYFDPEQPDDILARLQTVLGDADERARMVAEGHRRVAHFAPERYAERLAAAYARLPDSAG